MIAWAICIIIAIIIIFYYINTSVDANGSTNALAVPVDRAYLQKVVMTDAFFDRMSANDLLARGVKTKEQYKDLYMANADTTFTSAELTTINNILASLPNNIPYKYMGNTCVVTFTYPQKFVKVDTEGNYPHTIGDIICLPRDFFARPAMRRILLHELVHVWQRKNRKIMDSLLGGCTRTSMPTDACNNPDIDGFAYICNGNMSLLAYNDTYKMSDVYIRNYAGHAGEDHPYEFMAKQISTNI